MKVLVIGSGGREHAICHTLKKSPLVTELFCAPGNAGIAEIATLVPIKVMDFDAIVDYAKTNAIDLVFVAPDDPLYGGLVNALEDNGIKAFGPRKEAAIIEGSKAFSKEFMIRHNIPTAQYKITLIGRPSGTDTTMIVTAIIKVLRRYCAKPSHSKVSPEAKNITRRITKIMPAII